MNYTQCTVTLFLIGVLSGGSAVAQTSNEAQLQQLLEQAKGMTAPNAQQMELIVDQLNELQTCMADLDVSKLDSLRQRSEALMSEIRLMCAGGQRDKAQQKAIAYGQEVAASPELKKVAKCSAGMKGMLPTMAQFSQQDVATDQHVCDSDMGGGKH